LKRRSKETMAKNLNKIKQSLKLKAEPKPGSLTLKIGTRKFVLPFEPRYIATDEFVFIHLTPNADLFKVSAEGLSPVTEEDAEKAASAFRRPRGPRGSRKAAPEQAELPQEFRDLESKVPAGFRLGYDKEGRLKLIRTRKRRK
jgi:hypothetical protein